jgi:hypothetical protein
MFHTELLDMVVVIGGAVGFGGLMHAYIRHRALQGFRRRARSGPR